MLEHSSHRPQEHPRHNKGKAPVFKLFPQLSSPAPQFLLKPKVSLLTCAKGFLPKQHLFLLLLRLKLTVLPAFGGCESDGSVTKPAVCFTE